MKVIEYTQYGPPEVLHVKEVDKPTPNENQILVRVRAASVNPAEWHMIRGKPFIARMIMGGLLKPKKTMPPADVSGTVELVGEQVTEFKPGDEVLGRSSSAGYAEYVCLNTKSAVSKPATVTFEQAAGVPVAALTALQSLRDSGHVQAGQRVLVNGASGGVGTFAVQIAKAYGARVTGVCSTRNVELVCSLGAERVIDYTREDFAKNGQGYDLIVDCVGNRSVPDLWRALNPNGICVAAGFHSMARLVEYNLRAPVYARFSNKTMAGMLAHITKADLQAMKDLMEAGKVVTVIDRCYSFAEVPEAFRYAEAMHARGKVIIQLGRNN